MLMGRQAQSPNLLPFSPGSWANFPHLGSALNTALLPGGKFPKEDTRCSPVGRKEPWRRSRDTWVPAPCQSLCDYPALGLNFSSRVQG